MSDALELHPTPFDLVAARAEGDLRARARQAVIEVGQALDWHIDGHRVTELEEAIMRMLVDPRIAWALSYCVGATLTPEWLKRQALDLQGQRKAAMGYGAQTRPAQPLGERGAVDSRKAG